MDKEGYPEKSELQAIKKWNCKDVFNLIAYIKDRWAYAESGYFKEYWGKDDIHNRPVLNIELHTAGWSGNEDIIDALLSNQLFKMMWYKKWERGGHYYFEINPLAIGYKTVAEFAKEKKCSRQYLHHRKENFEWITMGKRNQLVRGKEKIKN